MKWIKVDEEIFDHVSAEVRVRNKIKRPDACPHASERRKIISFMHLSLEGFVAGPNGEINWIKEQ